MRLLKAPALMPSGHYHVIEHKRAKRHSGRDANDDESGLPGATGGKLRLRGLEPPRVTPLEPKSSASASSATAAANV